MDAETQFQRNLELWGRSHPKEALLMPYLESEEISFCKTDKGELNLCRHVDEKVEIFYSKEGALDEANGWFKTIDNDHVGVLYVYGIGLGYYYEAAVEWLHADYKRVLVFLEDDLAVLRKFLETERAENLLQDAQVHIVYIKDASAIKEGLSSIFWNVALAKAQTSALQFYQRSKAEMYNLLSHEIAYSSELKKSTVEEYLDCGTAYFMNCYRNIHYLAEDYMGSHLYGKFEKIPAIICGAGPSLEKNMHLLKQLKDRALIFAGGSAINILNGASIQPHLCAAIDPNEAQNVRLSNAQTYEVPFFYRHRLGHSAFKTIHGPRLFLTGSGGYDIAQYFEAKLNIESDDLDEGRNVINFCMEIAKRLGCDPIIFVGTDLAFTDCKTYSGGVVHDHELEKESLQYYASFESTGLLKKDIFGAPIYSLWKWIAESEWIGEWAQNNPELHLYNCTEGGLGFPNVPNISLREAAGRFLQSQYDLSGRIHCEIQNSRQGNITREQVDECLQELKESLSRCCEHLEALRRDTWQMSEKLKVSPDQPQQQSGLAALAETDLTEEAAYTFILAIFNEVYSLLQTPEAQQIKYCQASEQQKQLMRNELILGRLQFLESVAKANIEIMEFACETYRRDNAQAYEPPQNEKGNPYKASEQEVQAIEWKQKQEFDKNEDVQRIYYDSGALKGESYLRRGVLHGPSRFYTETGQLLAETVFSDGKREGECVFNYPSGYLYSRQHFVNGDWDGSQLFYYENGKIKTELQYKLGHLIATANLYDKEGRAKRKINFSSF